MIEIAKDDTTSLNNILHITHIYDTRVTIEPMHNNSTRLVHCYNCSSWGHVSARCHKKPICGYCADSHTLKDCPKTLPNPTCANCHGNHMASWIGDAIAQNKLNYRERNTPPFTATQHTVSQPPPLTPQLFPPLPPSRNAWSTRQPEIPNRMPLLPTPNPQYHPLPTKRIPEPAEAPHPTAQSTPTPTSPRPPRVHNTLLTHFLREINIDQIIAQAVAKVNACSDPLDRLRLAKETADLIRSISD